MTLGVYRERRPLVIVLVFLGGAIGSLARELIAPLVPAPWFWVPILVVNVLASFVVGWVFVLRGGMHPYWTHFLAGGFCGGFSTFSHFSYELVVLGDAGQFAQAGAYVVAAVMLGVGAAWLGEGLAQRWHGVSAE
jgi:CrcB protein